jgi:hypothetical protein
MKDVLSALKRNESVTLLRRGKVVGVIHPPGAERAAAKDSGRPARASAHSAFGMWKDRADMRDAKAYVDRLRKGRFDAL